MMTMHAAKVWISVVFIIGAEEGLFPEHAGHRPKRDMEEERRLCYVAITRAREKLYHPRRAAWAMAEPTFRVLHRGDTPRRCSRPAGACEKKANLWDDDGTFISGRSGTWAEAPPAIPAVSNFAAFWHELCCTHRRTGAAKRAAPEKPKTVCLAPKAPDFKKGDRVVHKAFG